ncbi:MAG: hypothetical protein KDE51_05390 [Anaerolineales bacterium]|nr:hypothetical protein [Anaerolineales bacterium]
MKSRLFYSFLLAAFLSLTLMQISKTAAQTETPTFEMAQAIPNGSDFGLAVTAPLTDSFVYLPVLRSAVNVPAAVENCQLLEASPSGSAVGLGFPTSAARSPSKGTMRVKVLFVDFPDSPATKTTQELFVNLPEVANVYDTLSYGQLDIQLEPVHQWFRINQSADSWAGGFYTPPYINPFRDALAVVDPAVDFSGVDVVYFLMSDAYTPFVNLTQPLPQGVITADGHNLNNFVAGSETIYHPFAGARLMGHEIGHTLGLPDLYNTTDGQSPFFGQWDTMANTYGPQPSMMAYQRWKLGWLANSQIYCQQSAQETIYIEAMQSAGGVKAVMVPLSGTKMVVVESHRAEGYKEGALVYLIDSAVNTGAGPVRAYPNRGTDTDDAPLVVGESVTVEGVTIEVLESTNSHDLVRVTRGATAVYEPTADLTNNTNRELISLIETLTFDAADLQQ